MVQIKAYLVRLVVLIVVDKETLGLRIVLSVLEAVIDHDVIVIARDLLGLQRSEFASLNKENTAEISYAKEVSQRHHPCLTIVLLARLDGVSADKVVFAARGPALAPLDCDTFGLLKSVCSDMDGVSLFDEGRHVICRRQWFRLGE